MALYVYMWMYTYVRYCLYKILEAELLGQSEVYFFCWILPSHFLWACAHISRTEVPLYPGLTSVEGVLEYYQTLPLLGRQVEWYYCIVVLVHNSSPYQ